MSDTPPDASVKFIKADGGLIVQVIVAGFDDDDDIEKVNMDFSLDETELRQLAEFLMRTGDGVATILMRRRKSPWG